MRSRSLRTAALLGLGPLAVAGLLGGCGATASQPASIDEERLADAVAQRVVDRIERDREAAGTAEPEVSAAARAIGDDAPGPPAGVDRHRVPVEGAPARGAEQPLVTLVQFSDFQCPFCSRVIPTIERLLDTYPHELRVVFRHNPLPMHKQARPAAEAAIEAYEQGGDDAFWRMHDMLFANQQDLTRTALEGYARRLELDMGRFRQALDGHVHDAVIRRDQSLASRLGARGTPAHFLNGRKLMGAQPYDKFDEVVRQEIVHARRLMRAHDVPRRRLYAAMLRDAATGAAADPPSPSPSQPSRRQRDPDAVYEVPVGDDPRRGPRRALVTIVEIADFECPFCKRVQPTLERVREEYGNDVRIVWMNNPLPFHSHAMQAAIAAREAYEQGGNRKFWRMHDLLFENQKSLSRDELEELAERVGLDMRRFERALDRETHEGLIEKQQALARGLGATGTPAFFVNGRYLPGAQPFSAFEELIDEELDKAREMVDDGVPRSGLYAEIIDDGATEPQYVGGSGGAGGGTPDRFEVEVPDDAPTRGDDAAAVTIQMWSDFQCPFCERVRSTLDRVVKEYRGQVKLVWRNYPMPMHDDAGLAAEAAWEIHEQGGDQAFWTYHDLLFDNQGSLSRSDLERYARQIGHVDMNEFRRALDNHEHRDRIRDDERALEGAGMERATPTFLVGDRLVQGAQPFSRFARAIDAELQGGGGDGDDDD